MRCRADTHTAGRGCVRSPIVELLNTAIEAAVDRDSLRIDALGKRAKDYGSAAVGLALLVAAGTWAAILISRFVL